MHPYGYISKMKIISVLTYRLDVLISFVSNAVMMFAMAFLWKSAYGAAETAAGVSSRQMITYAVLSVLLSAFFQINVENNINHKIQEGLIAVELCKPVNLLMCYLAEDIGNVIGSLLVKAIPSYLFALLLFREVFTPDLTRIILFVVSCILSYGILWTLSAITGLSVFWFINLGHLGTVKDGIVRILSGSLVPFWFFPSYIQKVSGWLPFQYTYQTPLGIYIGQTAIKQAFRDLAVQAVWMLIFSAVLYKLWEKAKNKVVIQGG